MSGPFDDLIPGNRTVPGAAVPKGFVYQPPPDSLGQQQKAAELARTQQEVKQAQTTAASQAAEAAARAQSAQIKAKEDEEAYQAAHPVQSNSTVIGPAVLNGLAPGDAEIVKALADGRLAFPQGFALKAPWWQQKLQQVAAYDPTFDATNFNNRAKARAMLLTGKVGTSANALNTAIGHVGMLNSQIGGTASHNFTPLNAVINTAEQLTGDPGITNFKDTAGKLASELTSVYRNGGGAEQDVIRQLQSLDPDASQAQKMSIVRNTLDLLASKQAANLYQYNIGSGGKPEVDLLDPAARNVLDQFPDIRDKYFAAPAPALSAAAAALLTKNGGTPPPPPPPAPPLDRAPTLGRGPKSPDYSTMVGGPSASLAQIAPNATAFQQTYRNEYDPETAAGLNALIHKGAPIDQAQAYAAGRGASPIDPQQYAAAVAYAKQPGHDAVNLVNATKAVPTTLGERLASSPAAAFLGGAAAGGTAGLSDVAGRTLLGPEWDANRAALAGTHGTADLLGNLGGGLATAALGGSALEALSPEASEALATVGTKLGRFAQPVGDMAYGGTYGAAEDPNNPIGGGLAGALTGGVAGAAGRKAATGLAGVLSPSAGNLAPLYAQGVFPTLGQKLGATGGVLGKVVNGTEQALQSVPGLGFLVNGARQGARDAGQVGAFNNALGEIGSALPDGMGPGTDAHAFATGQFNNAYDQARSGMQFVADPQYLTDTTALAQSPSVNLLNAGQKQQLNDFVNNAVVSRLKAGGGTLTGDQYKAASSEIGNAINEWGKNPDTALMANALNDYSTVFDGAARRNSDPAAVDALDAADRGYAQLVRIQRASQMGGAGKDAGTFTPVNYAGAVKQMGGGVRSSAYNQGTALGQDYADAFLNLRDTLPNSGTTDRLLTGQALAGLGGAEAGAGGALMAHPGALAPFAAYIPGVRDLVSRAVAPNAYRGLPNAITGPLDLTADQLNNIAPIVGRSTIPGALAYYGLAQ